MKLWIALQKFWIPFRESCATRHSAAACFYLFLSFPSSVTVFLWISARFPTLCQAVWGYFQSVVPEALFPWVEELLILASRNIQLFTFSLFTALWSSSRGLQAITEGLYAAVNQKAPRGFFRKRLQSVFNLTTLTCGLLLMLAVFVLGRKLLVFLAPDSVFIQIMVPGLRISSFALLVFSFAVLYQFLPNCKLPFRACLLGSILSAGSWILFSWIYSHYINYYASINRFYGITGLILLFLFWLQICITFFFYGAVLARLAAE